jgi:hypothetical protein
MLAGSTVNLSKNGGVESLEFKVPMYASVMAASRLRPVTSCYASATIIDDYTC